jgi:tetratricopeptide (TPR) repeat protein
MDLDAAVFQHGGWYITQGAMPYVDIWDPKPPLVMETTALLALLSRGDMLLLHLLSALVTNIASIGVVLLVGVLTHRVTGSKAAGTIAGLTVLTLPGFHYLPAHGFRPKYFMMFLGLLSVYLQLQDRAFLSGICAAASVGYWLLGAIFALISLLLAVQSHRPKQTQRTSAGMATMAAAFVFPIILWGVIGPAFIQSVLVHILVPESLSLADRVTGIVKALGWAILPTLFGVYGLATGLIGSLKKTWWMSVGVLWFASQLLLFDFDSYPDLFPLLMFSACGVGLLVAIAPPMVRIVASLVVVSTAMVSVLFLGGLGVVFDPLSSPGEQVDCMSTRSQGLPNITCIYWEKIKPWTNHYRLSEVEKAWIERLQNPRYHTQAEYDSAVAQLRTWTKMSQNDPDSWLALGWTYYSGQELEKASRQFERLTELRPDWASGWQGLASSHYEQGNYERSLEAFTRWLSLEPDNLEGRLKMAQAYALVHEYEQAIAQFSLALSAYPDWADAYWGLGNTYYHMEDYAAAETNLSRCLELDPGNAHACGVLGWSQFRQGKYPKSLQTFESCLEIESRPSFWAGAGAASRELGSYPAEIHYFEHWTQLVPESYEAWLSLGWGYYHGFRYKDAVYAFGEAVAIGPDSVEAYVGRGMSYERLGDCQAAVADFDIVRRLDPGNVASYNNPKSCNTGD